MTDVLFDCDACGGSVVMATGPGRRREYRPGITLDVPADHAIPTCASCGETYLTTAEATALEERLKEAYAAYCRQLVETVRARAGMNQRDLEVALGVTPTYLSHVTAGRKQPSLSLLRLLQAFAVHPDEAQRHLRGDDWRAALKMGPAYQNAYAQPGRSGLRLVETSYTKPEIGIGEQVVRLVDVA